MIKTRSLISISIATLVLLLGSALMVSPPMPPGAIGKYLNGILPSTVPGEEGSWALNDFGQIHISAPVGIKQMPESDDLLILSKRGELWQVPTNGSSKKLVLDISGKTFNLSDAGALGIVLHPLFGDPLFPDKQLLFVYYKTKPDASIWDEKGFSVLSKFRWDDNAGVFDLDSEEKLIQQYDRYPWHNGGPMVFGPDGFLYFSVGDEGKDEFQVISTQRLDGGFFNGVFRIDVDNDPVRSHPIRRQPLSNANPPEGWEGTFSQGYSIPNDNPWLSEDGDILEEFYALGARSPFTINYDEESDEIWLIDTGSDKREEINRVRKGDNLQWPYKEGTLDSDEHDKPNDLIGSEKPPYFEYERSYGTCVVGGSLYRNTKFPTLFDHYIYGDFTSNKIAVITTDGPTTALLNKVLISNITAHPVTLPTKPGITGIHELRDGRILVTVMGENHETDGAILELERTVVVEDPPKLLSQLGVFTNLETLDIIPGLIPYDVNSPLWSDGAKKRRWVAIPNDGQYDNPEEQIQFKADDPWGFPKGTVFVKHFEVPTTTDTNGPVTKLETRFFVITKDGRPYGITYRWNDEGTDAELLTIGDQREIDIFDNGQFSHTQTWDFPSRTQCITCHNPNAEYVLGVNTLQLNRTNQYNGSNVNQIDYFNDLGLFVNNVTNPGSYNKLVKVDGNESTLENRIRSYLDSNCSSCHREGGIPSLYLDFRYKRTQNIQSIFGLQSQSHASTTNSVIVKPGDHADSELWMRDASLDDNRMPPIGRNMVDQIYVDSLAKWIDLIDPENYKYHDLIAYPNPATDWIKVHAKDDWAAPYIYTLYSISGRPIRYIESQTSSIVFDVAGLPKGSYVISVRSGDNRQSKKVIVQ